jgi:excisionase family DNA binding protein
VNENGNGISQSDDRLMTVREVAEMLKVHPNTIRVWNNRGLIKAYRLGSRGDRRFSQAEIQDFLANNSLDEIVLTKQES